MRAIALAILVGVALAIPQSAAARTCRYDGNPWNEYPTIARVEARGGMSCASARDLADEIADSWHKRGRLPHSVKSSLGGPSYRCRYKFVETRDGGYVTARCQHGTHAIVARLYS